MAGQRTVWRIWLALFWSILLCPVFGPAETLSPRTIASFDFREGLLGKGFDNWAYSEPGQDLCGISGGGFQGYFCQKEAGSQTAFFLHYLTYNNDHMGWLRWGYPDAENDLRVRGSALKIVLLGGAYDAQGQVETCGEPIKARPGDGLDDNREARPCGDRKLPGDATLYIKSGKPTAPIPALKGMNRLRFWLLLPRADQDRFEAQRYSSSYRRPDFTFAMYPFIDDSRGGHYYHGITNIPMGGWVRVEFDAHPYHYNGGDKNPYAAFRPGGYEAPGNGEAYFSRTTALALRALALKDTRSPSVFYLDEITAASIPYENQETLSSVAIGFDPEHYRFDLSLTDKYRCADCRARYEVRYAFAPVTQAGFEAAIPCRVINFDRDRNNDRGLIEKPNSGYNQIWAGLALQPEDVPRLVPGTTVYFALKDISDRTQLPDRDPRDDDPVEVPGAGRVRQRDLIRTLAYAIHPVPWPLAFESMPGTRVLKQGQNAVIRFPVSGGSPPYTFYTLGELPDGLFLEPSGTLTGSPSRTGTFPVKLFAVDRRNLRIETRLTLEVEAQEVCNDGVDNDGDGKTDCRDTECESRETCGRLVVDWGAGPDQNRFGIPGWTRVALDRYTGYTEKGTASKVKGNPGYDFQAVSGPPMTLEPDSVVRVSWINAGDSPVTFFPKMSLTHAGRPTDAPAQWQAMTQVQLAPGQTGVSRFEHRGPALTIGLISINANFSNQGSLVCDKIRIIP